MHAHLVFVTKYRRKVFSREILLACREIFAQVCNDFECELVEFDGEVDHVHLLINHPPKIAVSRLVNSLKGVSSRLLRSRFPHLKKHYLRCRLWSPSYFASSCGGASLAVVRAYIENQKTPA
jgi:REP-associated tyrosine transposase